MRNLITGPEAATYLGKYTNYTILVEDGFSEEKAYEVAQALAAPFDALKRPLMSNSIRSHTSPDIRGLTNDNTNNESIRNRIANLPPTA